MNEEYIKIETSVDEVEIRNDKEYFRVEFKKVFEKWNYKLGNGMDIYDEEEFFNDLINALN